MTRGSRLTRIEHEIARRASIDLGAAYARISPPRWLQAAVSEANAASEGEVPFARAHDLDTTLVTAALDFLGLQSVYAEGTFVTFSGTIALNRTLAAVVVPPCNVVTTSPSLDVTPGLLAEHNDVTVRYAPADSPDFTPSLAAIKSRVDSETSAIVVASPENPTGAFLNAVDLADLCSFATNRRVTLVVDHSLASLAPAAGRIPLLPLTASHGLRWAMVWDTAKTFGINDEKLGFIVASKDVAADVLAAIDVIQFDLPARIKQLFASVLASRACGGYIDELWGVIETNRTILADECDRLGLGLSPAAGGSVQLVQLPLSGPEQTSDGDQIATDLLREYGLGVVPGSAFFHLPEDSRVGAHYLRFALARSPEYFNKGVAIFAKYMSHALHGKRTV